MSESKSMPPKVLDKRTFERRVTRGELSRDAWDTHLATLPDVADQGENIADRIYGAASAAGQDAEG